MRDIEQGTVLFSRYKMIDLIGTGGSSQVFLAENLPTGSLVAVKAVSRNEDRRHLMAEKELLKGLRHSSIPVIVDICEDEKGLYLIEEYVEGTALNNLVGELSEEAIKDIMLQLSDVLVYLHTSFEEPIIYRDMKPDNIIRMKNGRIKLIDFGIAIKSSQWKDKTADHYGTRGYAAPEQISFAQADERTDIFSLGVCIYYLLTGKNLTHPPYRLEPIKDLMASLDEELAAIITKCIQTMPSKRYQSARRIGDDVRSIGMTKNNDLNMHHIREATELLVLCCGTKRGIGTTHTAYALASHMVNQGKKVALIEWQDRDDFIKTASLYKEVEEHRHYYVFNGIECYPYSKGRDFSKILASSYDALVIDAGCFEEIRKVNGYDCCHELLMICGSKDWEIDYFEETVYGSKLANCRYLFNHTSKEVLDRISQEMSSLTIHRIPYSPSPYALNGETKALFNRIFGDIEEPKKKSTKEVLDEKVSVIRKKVRHLFQA